MPRFKKAKQAALKREASKREFLKRKNAGEVFASASKYTRSASVSDTESEPDSEVEFDDILDFVSAESDSESEYSLQYDVDEDEDSDNCMYKFSDVNPREEGIETIQLDKTGVTLKSGNVWETFNVTTCSELQNFSAGDLDKDELFGNADVMECMTSSDKTTEQGEENNHNEKRDFLIEGAADVNTPCMDGCCASLESLISAHDEFSAPSSCIIHCGDRGTNTMEGLSETVLSSINISCDVDEFLVDSAQVSDIREEPIDPMNGTSIGNLFTDSDKTEVDPEKPQSSIHKKNITDTHQYSQMINSDWFVVEGRRIVDWTYVSKCLLQAQRMHSKTCPGLLCMFQEKYRSMISTMFFECDSCKEMFKVRTEQPSDKPQLRRSMVWATVCSGGTFNSTKELLTLCNIPFMPFKTFISDEMAMDPILETLLEDSLGRSIQNEKVAVYGNETSESAPKDLNVPIKLSVALDGSWSTRSYGKRFNSASGCGVIVGEKSKKILYAGCKNKRCSVCSRAVRLNNEDAPQHQCYKNYAGSSGGMESDIMTDGFQKLMKDGIWLTTITTDGDSTTVAKLKNSIKYGASIQHQLCCNHVTKNCGKKLRELKYPKEVADIVSKNLDRITFGIRSAIKHCAEETGGKDIEGLRFDIRNVPAHVFGNHDKCRNYFCSKQTVHDENYVPQLNKCDVVSKIQKIVDAVAAKAEFLNHNKTSNSPENVFSRLCKYNVGKRLNLMSRGSYQRRVWITVLQHNEGYEWHYQGMEQFSGSGPNEFLKKMINEKEKLKEATVKSKNRPEYTRKPVSNNKVDRDYGPQAIEAAERVEEFERTKLNVIEKYQLTTESLNKIKENLTIPELEEFAKGRILSVSVADIVWSTPKTLLQKCDNILLTTNTWNYIKQNRTIIGPVTDYLKANHGYQMSGSRIFIDQCHSFLCCIPDAVSDSTAEILLVKKKAIQGSIKEYASNSKGMLGCKIKDGEISLDRKTMCEAQIALHICNTEKVVCVFVNSNNPKDYLLKEVVEDVSYFKEKVEEKIVDFFQRFLSRKVIEDDTFIKR